MKLWIWHTPSDYVDLTLAQIYILSRLGLLRAVETTEGNRP